MKSKIPIIILIFVCVVFLFFGVKEVYRVPYLYTYDPGFHYTMTQALDAQTPFGLEVSTYGDGAISAEYPSLMRPLLVSLHNITNLAYLDLFKLFGLFTRILSAFVLFFVAKYFFNNKIVGLVCSILFLSSSYTFFRGIITFPENLVIPFHILVLYSVVKSIRNKKIDFLLPVYTSASLLIHYPSAIIVTVIISPLVFFVIKDIIQNTTARKKLVSRSIIVLMIFLIFCSPVLGNFIDRYQRYSENNIGGTAIELISQRDTSRYEPLHWDTLQQNIGSFALLLALISLPLLFVSYKRENIILIIWLIFTFILTRGSQLTLFIPTGRMLIYFLVSTVFVTGFVFKRLLNLRKSIQIIILVLIALQLTLVTTITNIYGWEGIKVTEVNQAKWLNHNVDNKTVILNFGAKLENAGFIAFSNLETRKEIYSRIYKDDQLQVNEIKQIYPGKKVLLVINQSTNTILFNKYYPITFQSNGSLIYDLGLQ